MDVFEAPGEEYDGPWILISQGVLVFTGGMYLLLGLVGGAAYTLLPLLLIDEDPSAVVMIPFGILFLLLGLVVGGANLAAAYGLGRRAMWGYVIALIMAALYLPSGCMPFGALLAYGLLMDERTRKQFLK